MFNIVLYQPEIPPNTGNIARLCVATNSFLHLIRPLGFSLSNSHLRRAGLDYWKYLNYRIYDKWEDFLSKNKGAKIYLVTKKMGFVYWNVSFKCSDFFIFGSETKGLPEKLLSRYKENCITIPMSGKVRSLNLSDAVSIIVYEALRQNYRINMASPKL
ncbi:MAG: tRNA (uridine(34)/cytosine(34)/5-carboxymethylaminomethyluridine(34)-2'-O)-methyltransferase TrmL [Desulfurellaceae bacterium]|nr:tRNA (uridine(34)/cytosine(34)/5-carboxymethylaminomethyluridine(34)-2'-O)-methyltransferase TrmL [Desulfurellaceae bacterium]